MGGAGDDRFYFNGSNIANINAPGSRVDGGSGNDTLLLDGTGMTLDLTAVSHGKLASIEAIDLTGSGDNSLNLNVHNVLDLSNTSHRVFVNRNGGDSVTSTGQGWVAGPDQSIGDVFYHTYHAGTASLYVDTHISHDIS
jgi:hypothetical protein